MYKQKNKSKLLLKLSSFLKMNKEIKTQYNLHSINIEMYNDNYDDYYNDYYNDYYDDDYNYNTRGYSPYDDPIEQKPRKKGFTWTLMGSIIGSLLVGGAIAGTTIFLINKYSYDNGQTSNSSEIDTYYQKDNSQDTIDAIKYIYSRTVSVQFLYTSSSQASTISGTAWIFNRDINSSTYYLATNLHVAAGLTYAGNVFSENGQTVDFSNYTLSKTFIGFLDDNQTDPVFESNNLNMIQVPTPEVAYIATTDTDKEGFGSTSAYGNLKTSQLNTYASVDFAVLKFNFNQSILRALNSNSVMGNLSNVSTFESWLTYYNSNPTTFYTTAIVDIQNTDNSFSKYLYMGGFPGTGNKSNYSQSYSTAGTYLNFGRTSWASFARFPLAYNGQTIDDDSVILHSQSNIYKDNYNSYAGVGYQNFNSSRSSGITYFEKGSSVAKNYQNVGYYALLDANSLGGSSGSMIITKDTSTNKFQVVGIYWGQISYSDGTTVGVGNFLNINGWKDGYSLSSGLTTNAPAYDLITYANNKIKKDNPTEQLQYSSGKIITQ